MTTVDRPLPYDPNPWKLLIKERRSNRYRTVLYLIVLILLSVLTHLQNRSLERSYAREVAERTRTDSLIAENKRLRLRCPAGRIEGELASR